MRYMIKNEEDGRCLASINWAQQMVVRPLLWVSESSHRVILFENEEEAAAAIAFIRDVIDWEIAEMLTIVPVKE